MEGDLELLRLLPAVRTEVPAISEDLTLLVELMDRTFQTTVPLRNLPTLGKGTLSKNKIKLITTS